MSTMSILAQTRVLLGDTDPDNYWKEDWELNDAITAAVTQVEIDYPQGYEVTTSGEGAIDPTPDDTTKLLVAYKSAIMVREGDGSKSSREGIYVKDGDTVIDTTKGGANSGKSLNDLYRIYKNMIDNLYISNVNTGGYRIDMYDFSVI